MKPSYSIILIFGLLLSYTSVQAQTSIDRIFGQLKKTQNYDGASVPGWVIKLGILAISVQEDDQAKQLLDIGTKIKNIRVATTTLDLKKYNTQAIVRNFAKNITSEYGFAEYMSVKKEDSHLKIIVQEVEDTIQHLVILNEDKGNITMVHLKTNLTYNDLKNVSFNKLKNDIQEVNTITN